MISVDVDTRGYIAAMKLVSREALPEAIADALNETADAVTRRSLRNLKSKLTVRTKFTTNSLTRSSARPYHALNKARGRNVNAMFSRAGSISPYLAIQDEGGTVRPKRGKSVPIPTLNARTGRNIRRSIARRYNLGNMGDLAGDRRYFAGRPRGGRRPVGIYERYAGNKKLRMLRNLESASVKVPASRWHSEARDRLGRGNLIAARFRRHAQRRLQRAARRTH